MKRTSLLLATVAMATTFFLFLHGRASGESDASPDACRKTFVYELAKRRDEFRAHIFGSRRDLEGKVTTLTLGQEYDQELPGILATKGRLTSELIDPIVQSYRTYRCKLRAVCSDVENSLTHRGTDPVDIQILGCETQSMSLYPACQLSAPTDDTPQPVIGAKSDQTGLTTECETLVEGTLKTEAQILKMAVAYDAEYRSTLQFAGMMDWMMEDLPTNAIRPIRDMVNMLGKLHTIPCFSAGCDLPTPPTIK